MPPIPGLKEGLSGRTQSAGGDQQFLGAYTEAQNCRPRMES